MKEYVTGRFTDRCRRVAAGIVFMFRVSRETNPADSYTHRRPTFGRRYLPEVSFQEPAPHLHTPSAARAESFPLTEEDRGFRRLQGVVNRPPHSLDYDYPANMHGFPPPDYLLHTWEKQWKIEDAARPSQDSLPHHHD